MNNNCVERVELLLLGLAHVPEREVERQLVVDVRQDLSFGAPRPVVLEPHEGALQVIRALQDVDSLDSLL